MPGRDKTGPNGMGQRTGRGLGDCNDYGQNRGYLRDRALNNNAGFGRGRGIRMRRGFASQNNENTGGFLSHLEDRLNALEEKIDRIIKNK